MKSGRVTLTTIAFALLVLAFFLAPLPVTRIREHGLIQFQPNSISHLFVTVDGVLKKVHVREGEQVTKGRVIAEFENLESEKKKIDLEHTVVAKTELVKLYEQKRNASRDNREKDRFSQAILQAVGELKLAETGLRTIEEERRQMVLRAPRDGVVMGLPNIDEVGKGWEKGTETPFCSVGDRGKLRVLVPVHPSDMNLMRENLDAMARDASIPVTIRVQGRVSGLWKGGVRAKDLPKSEAAEVPLPLSSKGGGHVAVKPMTSSQKLIPQSQIYLVPVDFDDPDEAICSNTMARVKIHCRYRSAAWWTWRTISSVFELGLI